MLSHCCIRKTLACWISSIEAEMQVAKFAYRKPVNVACLGTATDNNRRSVEYISVSVFPAVLEWDRNVISATQMVYVMADPLCADTVEAIGVTRESHFQFPVWVQSHRCICATKSSFIIRLSIFSHSNFAMPVVKTGLKIFFLGVDLRSG